MIDLRRTSAFFSEFSCAQSLYPRLSDKQLDSHTDTVFTAYEATMQNTSAPREPSPSPSFRERQRALISHSIPDSYAPSASQVLNNQSQQVNQQPSPTSSNSSHPSRRTPPPGSRISPVATKVHNTNVRDCSPERRVPSPSIIHAHSQPHLSQFVAPSTQPPSNVLAHQPRPLRGPPQFLSQFQSSDDKWRVTDQLMAEIERADQEHQGSLQGTSGVAYAGGAASAQYHSLPASMREPLAERIRAADRASPKELDGGKRVREKEREVQGARESPKNWERGNNTVPVAPLAGSQVRAQDRTPEYRGSPQYQGPPNPPNERPQVYSHVSTDSYPNSTQTAPPTLARRATITNSSELILTRVTPPGPTKVVVQALPTQASSVRMPGRSLPVQEEPEEDIGHELPHNEAEYIEHKHTPPGQQTESHKDVHPARFDGRRNLTNGAHLPDDDDDDDEQTLNEDQVDQEKSDEDESSGHTPRSPSTILPERPRDGQYVPQNGQYIPPPLPYSQTMMDSQKTIRPKHRGGATDQLGMRGFDPTMFEHTVNSLRGSEPPAAIAPRPQPSRPQNQAQEAQSWQDQPYANSGRPYFPNRVDSVPPGPTSQSLPSHLPSHLESLHTLLDDPTSSYLQSFLQSPGIRPGAPIPPTPQTHTAAPSPSPGLSSVPSEFLARQIGSPYPYPFTHIRRAAQNTAPSSIDPNNPAIVREQLALQMQIYALNNGLAAASDSTFSPSSTPFPGIHYNPWGFVHPAARGGDSNMSMRSSPSHEPLPLPTIPSRGRVLRKKDPPSNLHSQVNGIRRRPPPRVESTQPRDTSPETSSGDETAGEERYDNQVVTEEDGWVNGDVGEVADDGEWVDENEDGDDDYLQLEYHPSFVSRTEKRRRRWETRWDALTQAVSFRLAYRKA